MITKIISGGQVGVDIAALRAAKRMGIETGGWMPLGFKTINGKRFEYEAEFGMKETPDTGYVTRTRANVMNSDGTLRIASNFLSYGEQATLREIHKYNKPYYDVDTEVSRTLLNEEELIKNIIEWLNDRDIKILNVAGNAYKDLEPYVENFITVLISIQREGGS